jgi:hypothetical protein
MNSLLIEFRDLGTGHNDLHLWLEGYSRVADSYYLAIDPAILPKQETPKKALLVLTLLLEKWQEALQKAAQSQTIFLPYDFSDEYTGCLSCKIDGVLIEIVPGFSNREGWSIGPSNPSDYFFNITDFRPDAPKPIRLSKADFLNRIQESIADTKLKLSS